MKFSATPLAICAASCGDSRHKLNRISWPSSGARRLRPPATLPVAILSRAAGIGLWSAKSGLSARLRSCGDPLGKAPARQQPDLGRDEVEQARGVELRR